MKKNLRAFLSYLLPVAVIGILSTGCNKTNDIYIDSASIKIEQTGDVSQTECSAIITPSEATTRFEYALGTESDRTAFEAGTLASIVKKTGNAAITVKFENLTLGKVYTIFARAYKDDLASPVTSFVPKTTKDGYEINVAFAAEYSVQLSINCTNDFYQFEYALGKASDRAAFEKGEFESTEIMEEQTYRGMPYFNLEPDTQYIFFARGYDRTGYKTAVIETPVKTAALGACPAVTMNIDDLDIFLGKYSFTGNSTAGTIAVHICPKGSIDNIIFNETTWKGDILAMFKSWLSGASSMYTVIGEGKVSTEYPTPDLKLENAYEAFVYVTDKGQNPVNVYRFDYATPAENKNAPKATATIVVSNITAVGATLTANGGQNTFAYMYDVVDADWYDTFKQTPDWAPNYLGNTLFEQGYWWHYGTGEGIYTEVGAQAEKRYYAAVVPMNENGPFSGWGDEVLVEFTTLAAPAPAPNK